MLTLWVRTALYKEDETRGFGIWLDPSFLPQR